MIKKFCLLTAFCAALGFGLFPAGQLPAAHAESTETHFQQSKIVLVTIHNQVPFYAEPSQKSLTLGFYPKGTLFVPINQTRNAAEQKTYNLAIRFDGAVGWLLSEDAAFSRK